MSRVRRREYVYCLAGTILLSGSSLPGLAAEMQYVAEVRFHDGMWGRYAEITIEQLPAIKKAVDAYANAAKQADLVAGTIDAQEANPPVRVIVPRLEYGMTGVFSNIRIETNEGISITPGGRVGSPGNPVCKDCTGQIVIEEFTPNRLRGRYSADLYNKHLSDRETRARTRDSVGQVEAAFYIDMSAPDPAGVDELTQQLLPEIPENLGAEDQALLKKMEAAGVPPEARGGMLQNLKGLSPDMQNMVLESYNDSY